MEEFNKQYRDYADYRSVRDHYNDHRRKIDRINNGSFEHSDEWIEAIDEDNESERIKAEKLSKQQFKVNMIVGIGIFVFLLAVSDKGQVVIGDFLEKIKPFLPIKK